MGKAKVIGQFKSFAPNSRADLRRSKAWKRNREYTYKHQAALEKSREQKLIREKEAGHGN